MRPDEEEHPSRIFDRASTIPSNSLLINSPGDGPGPRECPSLAPAAPRNYQTGSYWLCVVVVEVAGTSTTEAGAEVVVLVVDLSESQPVTDIRAAAAKQASRNVFISIF